MQPTYSSLVYSWFSKSCPNVSLPTPGNRPDRPVHGRRMLDTPSQELTWDVGSEYTSERLSSSPPRGIDNPQIDKPPLSRITVEEMKRANNCHDGE